VDFVQILRDEGFGENGGRAVGGNGGVVHSFTGTAEEVAELVCAVCWPVLHLRPDRVYRYRWDFTLGVIVIMDPSLPADYSRSVNGCSMKTEANLAAVKAIPPGNIMFETGRSILDPRPQFTL
jgi:TatD DNase family protein